MELYLALQALSAVLDSKATCSEMIIIEKGKMKGIFFVQSKQEENEL